MVEEIRKLKIYCLSDIARRLENTKRILLYMEKEDVMEIKHNSFSTSNVIYVFVNCRNPAKVKGISADQVIIDFREPMKSMAVDILRESCVPEQYQIIDDRDIGTSDRKNEDEKTMEKFRKLAVLCINATKYTPEEKIDMHRYYETDNEFRMITGKGLEELKSMFLAGYHLEPPELTSFSDLESFRI